MTPKIRFSYLLIVILITAAAFRCNSSVTKTAGYGNSYFPVGEGNYWKYINESPRDETLLYEVKIKHAEKINKSVKFTLTSFPFLTKDANEQTLAQNENGEIEAVQYMSSTGVIIPAPGNFKIGYEWDFGIFKGYVNGDKVQIKTEAGTFEDCYYILMTDGFTFSYEMWFKKEVGIVRWGANRTNPPTIKPEYFVLKDYNIN
jgi:hypothetical protein